MRTQSYPDECYYDRNLLVQLLAVEYFTNKKNVFISYDSETIGYVLICFQIGDKQISWHIPETELIIDLPLNTEEWKPIDVKERQKKIYDFII